MSTKPPYRRHAGEFKLHVCEEIRSGAIGRREAQRKYRISDNLIQSWLAQHAAGTLQAGAATAGSGPPDAHSGCRVRIAELEQKVARLAMELERRSGSSAEPVAPRARGSLR